MLLAYFQIQSKVALTWSLSSLTIFTMMEEARTTEDGDLQLPFLVLTHLVQPRRKTQASSVSGVIKLTKVSSTMTTTNQSLPKDGHLKQLTILTINSDV
jgi:hypothetical protein